MEPPEFDEQNRATLVATIQTVLRLESELIRLLGLAHDQFPADGSPSERQWFEEAANTIRQYQAKLLQAAESHDAHGVSWWAVSVTRGTMERYFDYAPPKYPQKDSIELILDQLGIPAKTLALDLFDRLNQAAVAAASRALAGFIWPATNQTLVSSIRLILRVSSELIATLDAMARESTPSPDLDIAWVADAKKNVEDYRSGLQQSSLAADPKLVSFWAGQFVEMQKYFSDQPLPSPYENQVRTSVLEIYAAAKIPAHKIECNDEQSLQLAHEALQEFAR